MTDPPSSWGAYTITVLAFVMDAVEHTETNGMRMTVEFDMPKDQRLACTAFFCFDCSALHVETEWFVLAESLDERWDLVDRKTYDPADVRQRMSEIRQDKGTDP